MKPGEDEWEEIPVSPQAHGASDEWEEIPIQNPKPAPGMAEAAMRGAAKGATFGFADNLTAALAGTKDWAAGKLGLRGDIGWDDAYKTNLGAIQEADKQAEEHNPWTFGISNVAGAVLSPASKVLAPAKGAGFLKNVGSGVAAGALSGAGESEHTPWDSPDELQEFGKDIGKGGALGGAFAGGLHTVIDKAGPIAAKVFGGVDRETIKNYLARHKEINELGAKPKIGVKDALDDAVGSVLSDRDALAGRAEKAAADLDDLYRQKKLDLQGSTTPLDKARQMVGEVQSQKGYLRSLSEQADDALERGGATFQKEHLLDALDQISAGQGDAIGDEAFAALSKMQATRNRVAEQLPDNIPAPQMRKVLKQLRRDIDFDQGAGEFNDTLNAMRKDFTSKISNVLKGENPGAGPKAPWQEEYSGYMGRMSDLSENLGSMNQYFGDESRALGSLEALRKGSIQGAGHRGQLIDDALRRHAEVSGDKTLIQHLDDLQRDQATLGRIKRGEDLTGELFPTQHRELLEEQANAKMAEDLAQTVRRMGRDRTQSVIENMGGIRPNIEDERALQSLSDTAGVDFRQMIRDRNIYDKFQKGQEKSGRLAIMGTALGGGLGQLVGGHTGMAVGASLGGTLGGALNPYGPGLVKKAIDAGVATKGAAGRAATGLLGEQGAQAMSQALTPQRAGYGITNEILDNSAHPVSRRQRLIERLKRHEDSLRSQGYNGTIVPDSSFQP